MPYPLHLGREGCVSGWFCGSCANDVDQGREKKANKLEQSGLSTEQLLAMQEEAFRDAAQRHG